MDTLLRALLPYEGKDVIVVFDGFRARVNVDTLSHPDETETGWGDWLVKVQEVIYDSGENPWHGSGILFLSLDPNADTPLEVTTVDGETIWNLSNSIDE